MEIPETDAKSGEQAQRIKHVRLGNNIFAIDDIRRVERVSIEFNPEAYRCHVYLHSALYSHIPINVKATAHEFKIIVKALCGELT